MKKNHRSKLAVSSVTAIFMLLIILTAIIALVAAYTNANLSLQKQMDMEKEQAQEQISITDVGIDDTQRIENITIRNSGTVEVIIRALYRKQNGLTTLLIDPLIPIAQGTSKTLNIYSLGLTAQSDSKFFVATQRGVKSMETNEIQINFYEYLEYTNSTALSIGPLLLTYDSLNWAPCEDDGTLLEDWIPTWIIPTGTCIWRINVTNIDPQERSITIDQHSAFTISLVSSPSMTTWYLKDETQTINWNQTETITYLWDASLARAQDAGDNQVEGNTLGVNNIFLTFYGWYSDGIPLAQTVPFEAITIMKK